MREEHWIGAPNPGQPFSCSPVSPAQALELPSRPADQVGVDTQQRWSQPAVCSRSPRSIMPAGILSRLFCNAHNHCFWQSQLAVA